jgi:hypothetical protein
LAALGEEAVLSTIASQGITVALKHRRNLEENRMTISELEGLDVDGDRSLPSFPCEFDWRMWRPYL